MANKKNQKKSNVSTWIIFGIGLLIFSYPIFAQAYQAMHQTGVVENINYDYTQNRQATLDAMQEKVTKRNDEIKARAEKKEDEKVTQAMQALGSKKAFESGKTITNLEGQKGKGIGVLSIPEIGGLRLPIFDGVSENVLRNGVGLLEGTSIPAKNQKGLHAVLTSHAGLPESRLFTNLGSLSKGDKFYIEIMGKIITYQVDRITVVKPEKLEGYFKIDPEKNYATLVTCTPLGINSHRLLVRGHEIPGETVPKNGVKSEFVIAVGFVIVAGGLITFLIKRQQKRRAVEKLKTII
ncbi:class C sortase [Weissella diestrammenae]|uniref:Class C sortase n=1 Tax=Weissella diestrammenae TaxID=1162633 RepID=A0A7G9T3H7_9LACO|nr:class C sortase [Weissella diestrammenae]MCM0582623.1 class C sortase [Weissella diestrammenae]QNN74652.1 class C sortase [Weissella diestrammenae]